MRKNLMQYSGRGHHLSKMLKREAVIAALRCEPSFYGRHHQKHGFPWMGFKGFGFRKHHLKKIHHGFRKQGFPDQLEQCSKKSRGHFKHGHQRHGHGFGLMLDQFESCRDLEITEDSESHSSQSETPTADGTRFLEHHFKKHHHGFRKHGFPDHGCKENRGFLKQGHHKHGFDPKLDRKGSFRETEGNQDADAQTSQNETPATNETGFRKHHFIKHGFRKHGLPGHFSKKHRGHFRHGHGFDLMLDQEGCLDSESNQDVNSQNIQNVTPADKGRGLRKHSFKGNCFHKHGFGKHGFFKSCPRKVDRGHCKHSHVHCWMFDQDESCHSVETNQVIDAQQGLNETLAADETEGEPSRNQDADGQQGENETPAKETEAEPSTSKE